MIVKGVTVDIDPQAGFCFGVERAVVMAEDALEQSSPVYCLGEMVHNEEELNRLQKLGLQHVHREDYDKMSGQTILFRAHGEPPESYEVATMNNMNVIDASCPIVKKVQQRIKESFNKGAFIIIFGNPDHPEVIGLNGQTSNMALVIERVEDLEIKTLPDDVCLYSQTTQSLQGFQKLVETLKRAGKKVEINNTICRQVSNRYPQVVSFSRRYDKVVFVGGSHSSNARALFGVARETNSNTWFVSKNEEVDMNWFEPGDHIGVTGATSTPPWLLESIAESISKHFNPSP